MSVTTKAIVHIGRLQGLQKQTSIPWAVRLSWIENAYSPSLFWQAILTIKVGQTDVDFGV